MYANPTTYEIRKIGDNLRLIFEFSSPASLHEGKYKTYMIMTCFESFALINSKQVLHYGTLQKQKVNSNFYRKTES